MLGAWTGPLKVPVMKRLKEVGMRSGAICGRMKESQRSGTKVGKRKRGAHDPRVHDLPCAEPKEDDLAVRE